MNETESKHHWMQIFDELKERGVKDVLLLPMDSVTGLEEGTKAIFPQVTVQRYIVHLICNSLKYMCPLGITKPSPPSSNESMLLPA